MANELDDAFDALPEAPVASSLDAEFDALPEASTPAAPVSPFKAKVGLSDPWEGTAQRYAQQRAEQEDLVRRSFKAVEGLTPELADAKLATFFDVPLESVRANRQGWLDSYAKANRDPRRFLDENPLAARLLLEHPERADDVVNDRELNLVLKGLNKALDFVTDTWDAALRKEAEMPWGKAAKGFRDTVGGAIVAGNALVVGEEKAKAELDALTQPRTPEQQAALPAERAQRDAPRPTVEVDNAEAAAIREQGPMAIAAQRAKESRAQLEVSKLWGELLWAKRFGRDTTELEAQIAEAERAAKPLNLRDEGWTQVMAEGWAGAQSTFEVLKHAADRMGEGAAFAGMTAATATAVLTKSPVATARAFTAGAALGAKFGGMAGAGEASFQLELGDSYKNLLQVKTDAGQQLSDNEAIGGALIAAALKTGLEMAELSLIMKALGPAGAVVREGGLDAVKRELATNPGFRKLAVQAAKAWVGEGVEEVAQGATDDGVSYAVRSLSQGQLQQGPVVNAEARKEEFVGGLLSGSVFGVGGLAVNVGTRAVFQGRLERSAAQVPALAALAENPKAASMSKELAELVAAKTAETGEEVTHMYVDASAFRRLFQTDQEAETAAADLMGEEGKKALANAGFTSGKLAVPLETYLERFGKDGIAQKLADDTTTRSDRLTPRELKEQQQLNEEHAKKLAAENRQPGESETLDRFDALEQQLVDSGRMSREEAKASMVPMRQTFLSLAKRFGQSVEDLFQNVRISIDDGSKTLLVEARQAHASQRLSAELETLPVRKAAERLFVDDHVSGLYTWDGWQALQAEDPAPSVFTVTLTDIKPVNDDVQGGHDTANALLAHVAPAVAAVDPRAGRKGTSFIGRGGQAELERVLEGIRSLLPAGMEVRGAVGADVGTAMKAMDTGIDQERLAGTLPKERSETKADLTKLPEMERQFAAAAAARQEQEATGQRQPLRVQVTPAMEAQVAGMTQAEYFRRAYQDPRVPGVLSAVAWDNIPRKAHVASIDLKRLKAINALGKEVGDKVLDLFAQVAARLDGSDFDFAHLSGDEYAAQSDDPVKLQAWLDALKAELTKVGVPHTMAFGDVVKVKRISPEFRSGIGERTYGNADRALNRAKLEEKRGSAEGAGGAAGRGLDAGGSGRVRQEVPGGEVLDVAGAEGGVRRGDGGPQAPAPAAYRRRGAAPQGFVGREVAAGVGQRPQRLEQDSNGFTDIAAEGTDKVYRIGLNPKANRSTFLHESAHVFLDLFGELAARADAPESVRNDWATTLKWLGVDSAQAITTEHHEKWAKAFESYLAKGEYPTARLAGAFKRFRLWMGQVYRTLTVLGPVSPDIAGVFDRLLATDEEIESTKRAMALKALPRNVLGLSAEDYQAHLDKLAEATSHAQQMVDQQVARDELRATESWWKEQHRAFKKQAAEEYEALPARRAQQLLQGKGNELFLGIEEPLHRAAVEAWVGKEAAKKFRLAKDGIHPDDLVEMEGHALGFGTGRDLVEAIVRLPEKEDFVEARADQLMVETYPGVLDERQRLRELVQSSMHGESAREFALREWRALTAKGSPENPRPMPTAATLRHAAELIAAGTPSGHLGLHAVLQAERKAASGAARAALAGNYEQAIVLKEKQLLNMYLFDALSRAKKEVERIELLADKLSKLPARQRLGKASPVYRDAVDLLLAEFGFTERDPGLKGSLDAALVQVEQLMAENLDTVAFDRERLVDRAETLQGKGWKKLPLEDLRQLGRALENINAAARNRTLILQEGKRVSVETAVSELEAELGRMPQLPTPGAENFVERMGRRFNELDGAQLKVERLAEILSGSKDMAGFVKSAMFRYLIEPIQAAKAKEVELYKKHIKPLVEVWDAVPAESRARQQELIDGRKLFPEHIPERLPRRRWEVLMMLLHTGNASNLERLTEGRGITEQQIRDAAVAVGITKEEYDWVQKVWDTAEGLKPLAFDLEEADSGVRPDAIEARPFNTPFGTMKGGYFPAVYDRITNVGKEQGIAAFQDPSYTRPATSKSYLKKRVEGFTDVISLDPGSIARHFNQEIHDIAYRRAIKAVATLLTNERVQAALRGAAGEGRAEQFSLALQDVARGRGASANDGLSVLSNLAGAVRGNLVVAVLGYKLPNALEDFTSNITSALAVTDLKAKHLAAAVVEFARDPMRLREEVLKKSPELRARQGQVKAELAKQVRQLGDDSLYDKLFNRGPLGFLKEHAFVFNDAVEFATSTPIWFGSYRQGLQQGMSDAEAVTYADATIRKAFISHNVADLSTLMRNKGYIGQLLMFFGAFNSFYNQFRVLGAQGAAAVREGDPKAVARAAARAAGLATGLFLIGAIARGSGPEKGEPVEEWLLRKLALEGFMQLVPGLNGAGNVLAAKLRDKPAVVRNNSLFGVGARLTESVATIIDSEKDTSKRVKELIGTLGPIGGVPTLGPVQSLDPVLQFIMGESDWRNPLDAASDVTYGRKRDEPFNFLQGAADLVEGRAR